MAQVVSLEDTSGNTGHPIRPEKVYRNGQGIFRTPTFALVGISILGRQSIQIKLGA